MGKALDIGKSLFNMVKGKGLEKDREEWGDNFVGDDSVKGHFNIGTFNAKLTDLNSLYRPNRYLVRFKRAPKCLVDASTATHAASDIMFFCDNVNIPGASIIPVDHKRFSIGPFDRRASNIIPAEISASFMLDGMGKNLDFFQTMDKDEILTHRKNKFLSIGRNKGFTTQSEDGNDLSMKASVLENINQNFKKNSKIYYGVSAAVLLILFLSILL